MSRAGWVFLVLFLTFLLYTPSLGNGYTWDDRWAALGVVEGKPNPLVRELRPIGEYFESHYWPARSPVCPIYRPVTVLTFALRHSLFGDDALPAHLLNLLLHVLATFLVHRVLLRLGAEWRAALAGALVFGVHAIHSEVVASVVGRSELLGFSFGAGALLLTFRARDSKGPKGVALMAGAAALLFLGCASKESALAWCVFIPLALLVASPGDRPRVSAATWVTIAVGMLLPAAVFLALRAHMIEGLPGTRDPTIGYLENPIYFASFGERLPTAVLAWGWALGLTVLPLSLCADYGPCVLPVVRGFSDPWFLGTILGGVALLGVLVGGLVMLRRRPLFFLAAACFLGFSFIVSNVPMPVPLILAERTYYIPSLALSLAVAAVAGIVLESGRGRTVWTLALGVWLGFSGMKVLDRIPVWKSNDSLIRRELAAHPDSVKLKLCVAEEHRKRSEFAAAARQLGEAARIAPGVPQVRLELARVLTRTGKLEAAEKQLLDGLRGRKEDVANLAPDLLANLARVRLALGKKVEAAAAVRKAVRLRPDLLGDPENADLRALLADDAP